MCSLSLPLTVGQSLYKLDLCFLQQATVTQQEVVRDGK